MAGALVRRLMPHSAGTNEIEKFTSDLGALKAMLEDAEVRRGSPYHILRQLDELTDLRCDMEDVLDEWNTALLKSKIAAKEEDGSSNKVRFGSCFCFSHVDRVVQRRHIALKMKDLTEKLNSFDNLNTSFRFNSIEDRRVDLFRQTFSFVDFSSVYGREGDRVNIIEAVLSESRAVPDVVSIVGMGGLGKTTLARLAYNDVNVIMHFDMRMWVCVSDPFDLNRVAGNILGSIIDEGADFSNLDLLFDRITSNIMGKKFLLVLDDVWNEDSSMWESLKRPFCCGADGSKILVTTRNENVARMMATTPVITLGVLSEEDSWSLFSAIAFGSMEVRDCKLEEIGRKVMSKCHGLPLALKVLGAALRVNSTRQEWQRVLNSEMWELGDVGVDILASLRLSYTSLGVSVRRCFSYCAIFPKDYMIETDSLIKMWMSQGFLDSDSRIEKELLGQRYFMDLASRSFFQEFEKDYRGNIIRCKMHDLVHDLAQSVTEHECFLIEVSGATQDMKRVLEKPRHGTFVLSAGATFPISTCNEKTLRTAFFLCSTNTAITHDVFVRLKGLRTLNLSDFWFKELPKEIGKFVHLRYLNLSGNDELKILPETLCELSNLQTLLVSKCMQLEKLPDHMEKLVSLRHLHVDGSFNLLTLPKGIAKLGSLRTLDMLVVRLYHLLIICEHFSLKI